MSDGFKPVLSEYQAKKHSAIKTNEYIYAQLIPYLGNKRKLLALIAEAVQYTGVKNGVFADMFAGSGVVSRWAKYMGYQVIANDWEPYAKDINDCYVGLNIVPDGVNELLEILNDPQLVTDGYITRHLCPADDENPHPLEERCFYTRANGRRIDAMRESIAKWEAEGALSPEQRAYLMASFLYAVSYVSNTSGVFKAYHHGWGGKTGTALYRILSDIRLIPPILHNNRLQNSVYRCDAFALAAEWNSITNSNIDIAYLDPPYNQHPYGSNYHVLNTVSLWDKPEIEPVKRGTKSAIRTDWRTERRSFYNHSATALTALTTLIDALSCRWILLSYSTDGNMPIELLLPQIAERGQARIFAKRYKRYRVSSQRMSMRPHNVEFVIVLDRHSKQEKNNLSEMELALSQALKPLK